MFIPTATTIQLPFNLHLRSSSLWEESRDERFTEGTGGKRETPAVRFPGHFEMNFVCFCVYKAWGPGFVGKISNNFTSCSLKLLPALLTRVC